MLDIDEHKIFSGIQNGVPLTAVREKPVVIIPFVEVEQEVEQPLTASLHNFGRCTVANFCHCRSG